MLQCIRLQYTVYYINLNPMKIKIAIACKYKNVLPCIYVYTVLEIKPNCNHYKIKIH